MEFISFVNSILFITSNENLSFEISENILTIIKTIESKEFISVVYAGVELANLLHILLTLKISVQPG